jgi:DNA-binding transcriptional ArsR family regulator
MRIEDDMPDQDERNVVPMPALPATLRITTEAQFKAVADPLRARILVLLQHEPLTAKQVADRLGAVPGTISHHVHVLENAGLVQVVATRLIHGIQAKYYARAARIFLFETPPDVAGTGVVEAKFLSEAHAELTEAIGLLGKAATIAGGFPHVRLSPERMQHYYQRLVELLTEIVEEPLDPDGQVYGLVVAFFRSPESLQPESEGETAPPPTLPSLHGNPAPHLRMERGE